MPYQKENIIYVDSTIGEDNRNAGWHQRTNNSINNLSGAQLAIEENKTLRVQDSTIDLPGVIRFNTTLSKFQGYTGNDGEGSDGWTSFQTFNGVDGNNGTNAISEMVGNNNQLLTDGNVYGLFKDVISETISTSTTTEITIDNQIDNLFSNPSYTYSSYPYTNTTETMNLSNKTLTFIPNTNTSYKVFVRDNDIYPPVNYYGHVTVRSLNGKKIPTNNNYSYYLGTQVSFYGVKYNNIYIHENGYLNFTVGDTSNFQNSYANHFTNFRFSPFMANLINNSDSGELNQADIHIGKGLYNELVITYNNFSAIMIDPNNSSNTISNNYNNFQIRIWLDDSNPGTSTNYSDDNYPIGTIQVSYGKCEFQTPLIGLSNKSVYNESTYIPLSYTSLLDIKYTAQKGIGVPSMETEIVLQITDTDSKTIIMNNTNFTNQIVQDSDKFKVHIVNTNWTTSYSEKSSGITYYSKVVDLGNIKVDSLIAAIKSIHDDSTDTESVKNYSDSTNQLFDSTSTNKNITTDWTTISNDKYSYLSNVYSSSVTKTKDYLEIYTKNGNNVALYNSSIYSIQARYSDKNDNGTGSNTTKLYSGNTSKTLLLKIIYVLKSDIDTPTTHSFTTATDKTGLSLSISGVNFDTTSYHYIPGNEDYYKIKVNNSKKAKITVYDFMNQSRNNYSLTLTIYKETIVNSVVSYELYKSTTTIDANYSYPTQTIDNVQTSDTGNTETYYIVISGNIKSYYYGINLKEDTGDSLSNTTNILQFTIPTVSYTDLTSAELTALKALIQSTITGIDSSILASLMTIILQAGSIIVTVNFNSSITLGKIEAVRDNMNNSIAVGTLSFTFNVNGVSNTFTVISNASSTTILESALPTDTNTSKDEEGEDDGGGGGGGGTVSDSTSENNISLKKAGYLLGNIHDINGSQNSAKKLDLYYHTIIISSGGDGSPGIPIYCYLYLEMADSSITSYTLNLQVLYSSSVNKNITIATLTFDTLNNLTEYPFNILKQTQTVDSAQKNKIVVVYGNGASSSKTLNVKRFNIELVSKATLTISEDTELSYTDNLNVLSENIGVVDDTDTNNQNLYFYKIDSSNHISIIKINSSGNSETMYGQGNIIEYDSVYDKFVKLYYYNNNLYLLIKKETDSIRIYEFDTNTQEHIKIITNPTSIAALLPNGTVKTWGLSEEEGATYNTGRDSSTTFPPEYTLNNIKEVYSTESNMLALTYNGELIQWGDDKFNEGEYNDNINSYNTVADSSLITNVKSVFSNRYAYAALKNDKTVVVWGRRFFGGEAATSDYSIVDSVTLENIENIFSNQYCFVGIKTDGSLISWGRRESGGDVTDSDYGIGSVATSSVFTNVYITNNAYSAKNNNNTVYYWGNNSHSTANNKNLTDNDYCYPVQTNDYIENVVAVVSNNYVFAALKNDDSVVIYGYDRGSGDYYGQKNIYYDFQTDAFTTETPLTNISSLHSNEKAFAAIKNDGSVITWGYSDDGINYGGSPYYNSNIDDYNWVSVKNDLVSGVIGIVGNFGSFAALKSNGDIIVWGDVMYGGGPYIFDAYSYTLSSVDLTNTGITSIDNIIPSSGAYTAIKPDGTVICWGDSFYGSNINLNRFTSNSDTLDKIIQVYTNYEPEKFYGSYISYNSFYAIRNEDDNYAWAPNSIITWGGYFYSPSMNNISGIDFNYTKYTGDIETFLTQGINKYNHIENYTHGKNILAKPFKKYIYYIYFDGSNYYLYRGNIQTNTPISILILTSIPNNTNIRFLQYEFYDGTYDLLLILYRDASTESNTNKLILLNLSDYSDIAPSDIELDGAIVNNNELYIFKYTTDKKVQVKIYTIGESSCTLSVTYEILNEDNTSSDDDIFMPVDYKDILNKLLANPIKADNNAVYFIGAPTNATENKYSYHLFLVDKTFNTRSLSFSDYETLSLENRIYDELNIQESLVEDLLISEIHLEIKNFLDNYQAIVYLEQGTIVLKVYNDYDFDTMDVYETSSYDNIQLEVYEKYLYVIIYIKQEYIVKKYSFYIEIQEIELNENNFTSNQFINCDIYQGDIIISELHQMEEETMLFIRKVTEESVELVSLINIDETDNLVITQLLEENSLIIVSNHNTYYQINLNDNSVVEKYLVNPPISLKLVYSNELIYIGSRFENGIEKAFLFRNNESLYELDSVKNLKIYQLELVNRKVLVIYSNNNLTKNILIYNLRNNSVVLENYKFEFLVMLEDLILLFDTRHHSNTFYVRYLSIDGKMLNLNVFQNGRYTYQELRYIRTSNNKIKLLGIRENEDDIETSYLIENIIYTNNSNGEYRTYETDVVLEEPQEESENLSLEITNDLLPFIGGDINMRGAGDTNLELYSIVSVVSNNYLFNDTTTYSATSKWQVKTGKYILKNIPPENPIAILTKNSPFITYKGLSYYNRNPNNLGQSLVKQITESGDNLTLPATATSGNTFTYYFYYGDVEIEITGDFGIVSYYSYNNGYMGGFNNLTYDNTATVGASITNNLYMREGNDRIKRFSYHGGDSNYSPYVVGRDKDTTYTSSDDDSGTNFYNYMCAYHNSKDYYNFYIKTNSIPNYEPSYGSKIIKGLWKTETTNGSDNYYAIDNTNMGWLDTNNVVQGSVIKLPIETKLATENLYTIGTTTIKENFWYQDDLYWTTLMVDTGYSNKLLTPMGPIGVSLNGISIYNFSIMKNTITETFSSTTLTTGNLSYGSDSNVKHTLNINNSGVIQNAVESTNSITHLEVFDSQGGSVDLNNNYHYHYYPITLEGQIYFGTASKIDPNNTVVYKASNQVSPSTFKMYIGHTYYFNVSHSTHDTAGTKLGFNYTNSEGTTTSNYEFENTLQRMGVPGNGYGSHVKFTVPDTFTSNDKLELVNIKFDNSTESSYGALYNLSSKIGIDYKPVSLNLKIVSDKFTFSNASNNIYDNSNKLYFEKDILYTINLDNSVTSSYKLGFKQNLSNYEPIVLTYTTTAITLRFIKQETGLSIYNILDEFDSSGDNYLSISVYLPNSINYYINVDTSQYKLFKSLSYGNYTFNGQLEWEDGYDYLNTKKALTGISGHSLLLGYAFDGHPIYGPLGYDKTTINYLDDSKSASREVKFLKSSYTSSSLDTNGNPQYVPNSGDLDFCNGIFSKTPEFPQGIYHYVCTIKLNEAGTEPLTVSDTDYGYRNIIRNRIIPQYPYIIGAFKGIPEVSNFPWATTTGAISDTSIEKKKFTFNFRSLKSNDVSVNGKTVKSISMTQDSNYINMLVNPQSYVWNFSNTQLTSFFGRDDYKFGNKISDLKSTSTDTTFKAYGSVSKWIAKGSISKGTAVRIVMQTVNSIDYLNIETYSVSDSSVLEQTESAAILGIALNDASNSEECYVCTKGITTVVIGNSILAKTGSYGVLTQGGGTTGRIIGLDTTGIIGDTPVVGYFLETKSVATTKGDYLLFQVSTNFEFN